MLAISWFNYVSQWVASEVLKPSTPHLRALVLCRFIAFAEKLRELNNFNGLMELLTGLSSPTIRRLSATWQRLPRRIRSAYAFLRKVMKSENNFKAYRDTLAGEGPPCIPYIGVILKDLVSVSEFEPDEVDEKINFQKREREAEIILSMKKYQNLSFNLTAVPPIQRFLLSQSHLSEDEMMDLSKEKEPPEVVEEAGVSARARGRKKKGGGFLGMLSNMCKPVGGPSVQRHRRTQSTSPLARSSSGTERP